MARLLRQILKILLIIVVTVALIYVLNRVFITDDEIEDVLTAQVYRGDIESTVVSTGQLEPKQYVVVGAQVSGQVDAIHVEEGDVVAKGELLVEIDATVFSTQVQTTEANLENKRAQLEQLKAERELAVLRAKRNRQLHGQDAVSADAVFSTDTALKVLDSKIRASAAQIKADEASLAGDKATLGFAKIYAPIAGTVATIAVRQGQTLNANQNAPTLLQISDLKTMTLRAEVSEAEVGNIYKGMPVYFTTLGDTKAQYHSTVRQVLPTPTIVNDVVLYQILIDIENTTGKLMDAMTTQVFFLKDQKSNTLLVPLAAIKGPSKRPFVLLMGDDGQDRRQIKTGLQNRTVAEVTQGLSEGETVIIGATSGASTRGTRQLGGSPPNMPTGGERRGF